MKFFIFALVIVFILQDYGTFQGKPNPKDVKLVGLFKKYALDFVQAAGKPFLKNTEFMEGGCECLSGVNAFEHVSYVDPILATMSIAKNYRADLELIRTTSESKLSEIMGKIKGGMMENIRLILTVLQTSQDEIEANSATEEYTYKKYLVKPNQAGASDADRNLESRLKCYRTLSGIEENDDYFGEFEDGFDSICKLMARNVNRNTKDPLWDEVDQIIGRIPKYELKLPAPKTKQQLDDHLKSLDAYEADPDVDEPKSESDSDSDSE